MRRVLKIATHASIWLVLVLLLNNETFDLSWGAFDRGNGSLLIPLLYGTALGALIFYLNTNWYIPRYFGKGSNKKYFSKVFGLSLGISIFEMIVDVIYLISIDVELALNQFKQEPVSPVLTWFLMIFISSIIPNFACWILAFAIRLPKDWINAEKQKNQLEKDKLQSELDFLKAQINPHFLFNGINSIYHLIGEDDKMARDTLLQFSGLLRYQLYDCGVNYISLEKELNYISNYINIEQVRKGEDAVFTFNLPDKEDNHLLKKYKIAPLLLTPFIENAFKYLSFHSCQTNNFINMDFNVSESGVLHLKLSNSFDRTFKTRKDNVGGIGLENVKRRLKLLYPNGKHQLNISSTQNVFTLNLKIDLDEN